MILKFTENDFKEGQFENISLNKDLILNKESNEGIYTSKVYQTVAFNSLVASWNSNTTPDCSVELQVRVKASEWSIWLSYGVWKDLGMNQGSVSKQSDDIAKINVDEVICKEACDAIQYRIIFRATSMDRPIMKSVFVSLNDGKTEINYKISDTDIEVPIISQMLIPDIGNIICSPTSLSMVMNYYGMNTEVIDTSQGCFDNGAGIYGNWSYNVAYAGERGLISFVDYCYDPLDLVRYIQMGIPVIASLKTKDKDELKGSPQAYPSGHLVVIRGFSKDEQDYIIVNDPAAKTEETVKRYYLLEEFLKVWNNIIYVIRPYRT